MKEIPVHVRFMIRADMPEVLGIEKDSFPAAHAWDADEFADHLRTANCIGMVAEHGDKVLGYMIYELHKRQFVLLNFAVCPWHRHARIGTQMAARLIGKLSSQRRTRIIADVSEANKDAHLFWRAMGFRCIEVLENHFDNCDLAAYRFRYEIPSPVTHPTPRKP